MFAKLLAAVLVTVAVNAHAAEVHDIVLLTNDKPACRDIDDTQFANEVGDVQGRAMLDSFIGSGAGKCIWLHAGDVRFVAEKQPTRLPVPIAGTMAYCLGELIAGTNREDRTKPCLWVYMK